MKRHEIRGLKRAVTREKDPQAMLELLERSIRFGHKKLALSRCIQAEQLGMCIAPEILAYCRDVADSLSNEVLHKLFREAASICYRKIH
jgi:hypothetical protein